MLIANLAPVVLPEVVVAAEEHDYEGRDTVRNLRLEYGDHYVVVRDDNRVLCFPRRDEAPSTNGREVEFELHSDLRVSAALVRDGLIQHFNDAEHLLLPSRDVVLLGALDSCLLRRSIPRGVEVPHWLSVLWQFSMGVRVLAQPGQAPAIHLVLDSGTTQRIHAWCAKLLSLGIDLRGRYVCRLIPMGDKRLYARTRAIGRVVGVAGDTVRLEDAVPGHESVASNKVVLEQRFENLTHVLRTVLGKHFTKTYNRLRNEVSRVTVGPRRLQTLRELHARLSSRSIFVAPGVSIGLGSLVGQDGPLAAERASEPVYIFQGGQRRGTDRSKGLEEHGPYSSLVFTPSRPNVGVICQKRHAGHVDAFVNKLLSGLPSDRRGRVFTTGLVGKYAMSGFSTSFHLADDATTAAYARAAEEAIRVARDEGRGLDLVLVQTEERFKRWSRAKDPYVITKALLHTHQVPVQQFTLKTMGLSGIPLRMSLDNMALASYAKLNGVPWLLGSDASIAHELVVGLASTSLSESRLGERERMVGITTVFSGDGNYWLSSLSSAVPAADYRDAVLRALRNVMQRAQKDMNWRGGDSIRLVFHSFKPFRGSEAEAVIEYVNGLTDFDVKFAFLHVAPSHPFVVFDTEQTGTSNRRNPDLRKGVLAPARGTIVHLSDHEALLSVKGAGEVKRASHGLPRPLLLRLHERSTFHDMGYLAKQAFAFTAHSWRGFRNSPTPVTIRYSYYIANNLAKLGCAPRWNPDVMLGRIGTTRWFL